MPILQRCRLNEVSCMKNEVEIPVKEIDYEIKAGCLSKNDIYNEILNNEIQILPFRKQNLTGLGYNLTPSDFVFSTGKKILLEIQTNRNEKYVMIPPNDTALILSKEYVSLSGRIMGTFHSRVRMVSQGLGHISTTLDPGWKGPLLFAINNPSRRKIKFLLQSDGGKGLEDVGFTTLIFQYLNTPLDEKGHDNRAFRIDVLWQYYMGTRYSKRIYNKSFKLLNEIIETTRKMSPENPISEVDTSEIDKLAEYLTNILMKYEQNHNLQEMTNRLKGLEYGFMEATANSSEIFLKQIARVKEQVVQIDINPTEENVKWLCFYIKVLIGGCRMEKKNQRWLYYTIMLEDKIGSYRISKRMRLIMLWHRKWTTYIKCLIGGGLMGGLAWISIKGLGLLSLADEVKTGAEIVATSVTILAGEMFAFFLNHFLKEKEQ